MGCFFYIDDFTSCRGGLESNPHDRWGFPCIQNDHLAIHSESCLLWFVPSVPSWRRLGMQRRCTTTTPVALESSSSSTSPRAETSREAASSIVSSHRIILYIYSLNTTPPPPPKKKSIAYDSVFTGDIQPLRCLFHRRVFLPDFQSSDLLEKVGPVSNASSCSNPGIQELAYLKRTCD